jgi:hypothetical protein
MEKLILVLRFTNEKKKDEDEETGDTESIENKYMTCLVWLKIKIKIHS